MRLSKLFTQTQRQISKETESLNAQLLTKAGFIRQELAGAYNYLPLGLRVLTKIEQIVREEMDTIASEALFSSLSPKSSWQLTDRLDKVDVLFKLSGANKPSQLKNDAEYILNPTQEEIVTPLAKSFRASYKDFPFAMYQIATKYRNEPRAKSGLLRGREFRMKDLYSFHADEADLKKYYEASKVVYAKVYQRLGIGDDTFITLAGGGDFTDQFTHEFQTLLPTGEDTIYLDRAGKIAYNQEIIDSPAAKKLGVDFDKFEKVQASEVGNIFILGTKFAKAFDYSYTDEQNHQQLVWMGCYGIGTSRLMGVIAEKFADEKGLVWPEVVAPFVAHLMVLGEDDKAWQLGDKLYDEFLGQMLYDDRKQDRAGAKFADADLIGCPWQVIVSDRTMVQNKIELKNRHSGKSELLTEIELTKRLKPSPQ